MKERKYDLEQKKKKSNEEIKKRLWGLKLKEKKEGKKE